jgi:hypothetical protein
MSTINDSTVWSTGIAVLLYVDRLVPGDEIKKPAINQISPSKSSKKEGRKMWAPRPERLNTRDALHVFSE